MVSQFRYCNTNINKLKSLKVAKWRKDEWRMLMDDDFTLLRGFCDWLTDWRTDKQTFVNVELLSRLTITFQSSWSESDATNHSKIYYEATGNIKWNNFCGSQPFDGLSTASQTLTVLLVVDSPSNRPWSIQFFQDQRRPFINLLNMDIVLDNTVRYRMESSHVLCLCWNISEQQHLWFEDYRHS